MEYFSLPLNSGQYCAIITYFLHGTKSSWKANRFSANREISRILWKANGHYRIHTSPPPVPILSQLVPVHAHTFHFLKIHLNIILHLRLGLQSDPFPSCFPNKTLYTPLLPHTCYIPRPSHSSLFDHPNNIGCGVQIMKLLIMQFSPLPCYLIPLRPKYLPQHPILLNTLSLHSYLTVSDQISHQ